MHDFWQTFRSWRELLAVYAVLIAAAFMFYGINHARAQDHEHRDPAPHERYHDYYLNWQQPIPPNSNGFVPSCCSANTYTEDGQVHLMGDCEPTTAELRRDEKGDTYWVALLPRYFIEQGYGPEVVIPEAKIIREINPEPQSAHLCWTPSSGVLCFVPPFGGF